MSAMKKKPTIPHLDLYNFEEPWAKETQYVLTSPRSLEACNRCAVQPVQLLYKSLQDFEQEMAGESLLYTELYDRYQLYERDRQQRLKEAREERQRIIWSETEKSESAESAQGAARATPSGGAARSGNRVLTTSASSSSSSIGGYSSTASGEGTSKTSNGVQSSLKEGLVGRAAERSPSRGGTASRTHLSSKESTLHATVSTDGLQSSGASSGASSDVPTTKRASSRVHFTKGETVPQALDKKSILVQRGGIELVGQKIDLQQRPVTPQSQTRSISPVKTTTNHTQQSQSSDTDVSLRRGMEKRSRHQSAPSTSIQKLSATRAAAPSKDLSSSLTSGDLRKTSTTASRSWNSADGAALLSGARKTGGKSETALWSPDDLAAAVISVGMSSMDAHKMALLSERDRRILQNMVERRRRDSEHKMVRITAEETWKQQAEKRRAEKQLEEQEHRKALEKKRERERAILEQRLVDREQVVQEEVDALQQEIMERDEKWTQRYEEQQQRMQRATVENAEKEEKKKQLQELRRAELLAEEAEQKRLMLEQAEAKLETAAEAKERKEREELERLKAKNIAERQAISARLKEIESQEEKELEQLQREVENKHLRADERLAHVQHEKDQLLRTKAAKRDRQADRNRQVALQLEAEQEQLRLAAFEERLLAEQRAAEVARRNVEERSYKAAEVSEVRKATHSRNLEKIRHVEEQDKKVQQRQVAEKQLKIEILAREKEAVVKESREKAREAELLREKLREYCQSDTFDRKVQTAERSAPLENPSRRVFRSAAANMTSSKVLLG